MSRRVAIALGSNMGDRAAAMSFATDRLSTVLTNLSISTVIETAPEGAGLENQPAYLNAVVVGETPLGPRELLDELLAIECEFGRKRPYPGAPRTLDLDLVLFGEVVVNEPGLHVPHPRFRDRFFVLGPMAEIAPELEDPVTGLRVVELLRELLRNQER
jgi:2-amino-4-hydroxy-6-hydroxymethyldihydropteridine diphosphokinase